MSNRLHIFRVSQIKPVSILLAGAMALTACSTNGEDNAAPELPFASTTAETAPSTTLPASSTTTTEPVATTAPETTTEEPRDLTRPTFRSVGEEPTDWTTDDAARSFAAETELDEECVQEIFKDSTADELRSIGIRKSDVGANWFRELVNRGSEPVFEVVVRTLTCAEEIESIISDDLQTLDRAFISCYVDKLRDDPNLVSTHFFGTTDGSDVADAYPPAVVSRIQDGLDRQPEVAADCL